jgi:SAM-dependent methyltransferase
VTPSLVYRSALVYESAMLVLYGRHYFSRYRVIADLIPREASILDICCGPARIYHRHLKRKGVKYYGLDINKKFISTLVRAGADGEVWDLRSKRELPRADYVVMQAALYHFLPDAAAIVDRMLCAARKRVIIAEPIRNLADSKIPLLSALARHQTDPGIGGQSHRFTESTLDQFMSRYTSRMDQSFLIPGSREKVFVLGI